MEFPEKLRSLRLQRGMSQMQLAYALGSSQSAITAWELGKRDPDMRSIKKIASVFGVPVSYLISDWTGNEQNFARIIVDAIRENGKLFDLFEIVSGFDDSRIDALIAVARTMKQP